MKKNDDLKLADIYYLKLSLILVKKAEKLLENKSLSIFSIIQFLENKENMLRLLKSINVYADSKDLILDNDIHENSDTFYDNEISTEYKKKKNLTDAIKKNREIKLKLLANKIKSFQKNDSKIKNIMKHRENLPTWLKMNNILKAINENQVTIISGETGCGKSTQVISIFLIIKMIYFLFIMTSGYDAKRVFVNNYIGAISFFYYLGSTIYPGSMDK